MEFIAFFLDILHEELNRVSKKAKYQQLQQINDLDEMV